MRRQPILWILVEEWPRRNDDDEGEGGASEADIERQLDVLCGETNKEGDYLAWSVSRRTGKEVESIRLPRLARRL